MGLYSAFKKPEDGKRSTAQIISMVISIGLHVGLLYYLGNMALDYALPEGSVTSVDMDFQGGATEDATTIDIINEKSSEPIVSAPPPKESPTPIPPPPPKATPVKSLPQKTTQDTTPIEDSSGDIPVPIEEPVREEALEPIAEEPLVASPSPEPIAETAENEDLMREKDLEETSVAPLVTKDEVSKLAPDEPPQAEEAPLATNLPPAKATNPGEAESQGANMAPVATSSGAGLGGVQSDSVLIPFGNNRPISYPRMARFRKYEGTSIIHYTVSEAGVVTSAQVVQSSGYEILDREALETIKTWKFRPTGKEGVYERPVRYSLKGESKEAPGLLRRKTN